MTDDAPVWVENPTDEEVHRGELIEAGIGLFIEGRSRTVGRETANNRARRFRQLHGTDSVELDAIPPDELRRLVKDAIDSHMEPWRLEQFRMVEREERQTLNSMFGGAA